MNLFHIIKEFKLELALKEASNNYESLHFFSYVFQKPSSDLPSLTEVSIKFESFFV